MRRSEEQRRVLAEQVNEQVRGEVSEQIRRANTAHSEAVKRRLPEWPEEWRIGEAESAATAGFVSNVKYDATAVLLQEIGRLHAENVKLRGRVRALERSRDRWRAESKAWKWLARSARASSAS
jgi:hypothetical protein